MKPAVILINPWIYDFAAYDLWAKPLGLLYLASHLRERGFSVHLIDCLDVHNPLMKDITNIKKPIRRKYGTGKFWKQTVPKPPGLSSIPRLYSRYGIAPQVFIEELKKVQRPAAILVTSLMTYWYPGVFEAINLAKDIHPDVPIILGSPNQFSPLEFSQFLEKNIPNFLSEEKAQPFFPYPAFDLLSEIDYICLLSSSGCPFRCTYCASHYLSPSFIKREPRELFEEVFFWSTKRKSYLYLFRGSGKE
ncbi:MAG: hypothetical protein JRJ57_08705 [Deltaproteobacteria bacterium]|nr:hypothetical protein [Deltaproteobacteria bacterium]